MRCITAARAKATYLKYRSAPLREKPKVGSKLRQTYDALQASKGHPTELPPFKANEIGVQILQLENFYGLDIRLVKQGSARVGRKSTYVLAGEWFGRVYVDYIAERLEAEKLQ